MTRLATRLVLLVVLLALAGCSAYHTVDMPWRDPAAGGEFGTVTKMRVGDLVRVTTDGAGVTQGILVEYDATHVTVADTAGTVRLVTLPVGSVRLVEVYQKGAGKTVGTAVLAVAGAVVAVAILDEVLEDDPDWCD